MQKNDTEITQTSFNNYLNSAKKGIKNYKEKLGAPLKEQYSKTSYQKPTGGIMEKLAFSQWETVKTNLLIEFSVFGGYKMPGYNYVFRVGFSK